MNTNRMVLGLVVVLGLALTASAQFAPTALLFEGGPIPNDPDGNTVRSLGDPSTNDVGGFGALLSYDGTGGDIVNLMWGAPLGGSPQPFLAEGLTFGSYITTSIQTNPVIDNFGATYYSASVNDFAGGATGLDSMWKDDSPFGVEDEPIASLPGQFFSFLSGPTVAADASAFYYVGGIANSPGGSSVNRALFDKDNNPVLIGGGSVGGVAEPIDTGSFTFGTTVSGNGSAYITEMVLDAAFGTRNVIVVNGDALSVGGSLVREGTAIPAAVGGQPGESWDNFDHFYITEAGEAIITGDSDGSTASDEFIFSSLAGMVLREGDQIGGWYNDGVYTVAGSIDGFDINESSDWVADWNVDSSTNDALLLNGLLLVQEGDQVDLDGNGLLDDSATLVSLSGIDDVAISERDANDVVTVYFTAEIDTAGTSSTLDDFEALLSMSVAIPEPASVGLLALCVLLGRRR
jgi:hypothetical protein